VRPDPHGVPIRSTVAVHALLIAGLARPDLCGRRHAVHRQLNDVALAVAVVPAGRDPGPGVEHLAARPFAAVLHHHQADELRHKASLGTSTPQHWGSCDRASTYRPYIATVSGGAPIGLRDHRRAPRPPRPTQRTTGATSVAMLRSAACSSASSSRAGSNGGRPWGHTSTPPLESSRRAVPTPNHDRPRNADVLAEKLPGTCARTSARSSAAPSTAADSAETAPKRERSRVAIRRSRTVFDAPELGRSFGSMA
jgi:hypothetical protein